MLYRQPQRYWRDQVGQHGQINQRLAPLKMLRLITVVQIEHDVRPAMRHVVRNIDRRARQGTHHQQRQAGQALAPEQQKIDQIGKAHHYRKILGEKPAALKQARQRVQAVSLPVKLRTPLSPQQTGSGQH